MDKITSEAMYNGIPASYSLNPQGNCVMASAEFRKDKSLVKWEANLPLNRMEEAFKRLSEMGEASLSLDATVKKASCFKSSKPIQKGGVYISTNCTIGASEEYIGPVHVRIKKSDAGRELIIEFEDMIEASKNIGELSSVPYISFG
jgi:hypothetical protein